MLALAGAIAVGSAVLPAGPADAGVALAARAVPAIGAWGRAAEVPGLAGLNAGGRAEVLSVSCGSAGGCAAVGSYQDRRGRLQGFVVGQQGGGWSSAIEVPGLAALNAGGSAEVLSVSCGLAGNCAAGGYYYDRDNRQQGFVTGEQGGIWSRAIAVPGLAALNAGGFAEVLTVSCEPTGGCSAAGYYYDRRGQQGFVTNGRGGKWTRAIEVPGLARLNTGFDGLEPLAGVSSVSCGSAGDCAAGGSYQDRNGHGQAFVASERNGSWGRAIQPPGLARLNAGGAGVSSVSCVSAGNCTAGGGYTDRTGRGQGFVVVERNGTWQTAIKVPGLAALNASGSARISSLSCGQAGDCAASGSYLDRQRDQQGFVVVEQNGRWGKAIEVPGLASLNDGVAQALSVSCGAAGNCAAGGYYQDRHRKVQGFVISQTGH